ncbi:hypothetical protein [Caproiciproducens galactitolivorans]|uniref:hypothetical protein n=1 Tax=Caproiciproducens galactitolivorans TaxID=642589 RepID=UPI00240A66CA|nr:hypothetical protein [Caproiciproducens galactitolivorans]
MIRKKKSMSLLIAFAVLCMNSVPAFAATPDAQKGYEKAISPSTVITEENIYDVLKYVGIDESNFKKADTVQETSVKTVQDLLDVIDEVKLETKNTPSFRSTVNSTEDTNRAVVKAPPAEKITLSADDDFSSYTLHLTVLATVSGHNFRSAGSPKVTLIDSPSQKTHHKN